MRFQKKQKSMEGIPTASMPDIVFMLLIFFMVTTVLKKFDGLPLDLPHARKIEKLNTKRHVSYIWVSKGGMISVDDKIVPVRGVRTVIYERFVNDPRLIVSMKIDQKANFGIVSDIHQELREAGALRVNYSSKHGSS
ncbi:MAG: biopolymer transporter ExbD [Candidatus Marinimicrobia bacterium]|nr:biopolymer transporter ExbD [Candidatus Neomarinimicrobiota bacterium]